MREIKFRGINKKSGMWVYGPPQFVEYDDVKAACIICWADHNPTTGFSSPGNIAFVDVIPETVGQFTGHQINGVDLYEGDIVRLEENADGVDPEDRMIYYVVTWLKEWSMFALLRVEDEYPEYLEDGAEDLDTASFWCFPLDPQDTETSKHYLCGNIHQHPHLLTPTNH